ncbi:MAG TPA: hypothetical protein VM553_14380 [Dongiaceae bacterium]|nr:hypothetical protein [Dongiaceae bacterium]
MKSLSIKLVMMAMLMVGAYGCEKEGPAERAGEKVDNATTDIGNKIEDACEDAKESAGADDTRC